MYLAKLWSRPKKGATYHYVTIKKSTAVGLCGSVSILRREERISPSVTFEMNKKIMRLSDSKNTRFIGFKWATDKTGARDRLELCKEMAAKLRAKAKKKKEKPVA